MVKTSGSATRALRVLELYQESDDRRDCVVEAMTAEPSAAAGPGEIAFRLDQLRTVVTAAPLQRHLRAALLPSVESLLQACRPPAGAAAEATIAAEPPGASKRQVG